MSTTPAESEGRNLGNPDTTLAGTRSELALAAVGSERKCYR